MKSRILMAAAAIITAACSDATAPVAQLQPARPANAVDNSTTVPSVLETVNPCNGDAVTLTGTLTTTTRSQESGSGNVHTYYSVAGSYTGIGVPSGAKYSARTENSELFNSNGPDPMVDDVSSEFRVISAGSTDNFTARVHYHVTINALGAVTVDNYDVKTSCNG